MNVLFTLDELEKVAADFWKENTGATVFAFHGEMGAGKTTFIQALCKAKKVSSAMGSPTYAIINQYAGEEGFIYHMDLYRLKDELEAVNAGVEDALYSGDICLVEWPERAPALFPEGTVQVYLKTIDTQTRNLWIE